MAIRLLGIVACLWSVLVHAQPKTRTTLQLEEISIYFNEQGYLLLDSNRWTLDPELFPLENDQFFYVQYQYKEEPINKRLFALDRAILVTREDLFKVDGVPIEPHEAKSFELYYYIMDERRSEKVTDLNLTVLPKPKLIYDIRSMIKQYHMEDRNDEQVARAISNVWRTRYGNVDLQALKRLITEIRTEKP